uniref:AlNc14C364G11030 protein n=1 Tax=Albugo laibachii Nc14 TaxID=890382 RepID=F0WXU3_9STRA|nr:AlNc14C364G11030 [Albugo laibachii Nc14]|eukprot:CCA26291.1 AlNc14C364G11030 [Albugo laibachii Nc14]
MFIVSRLYGTFRSVVVFILSAVFNVTRLDKALHADSNTKKSSLSTNGSIQVPTLAEKETDNVEIVEAFGSNVELPSDETEKQSIVMKTSNLGAITTSTEKSEDIPQDHLQNNEIDDTSDTLDSADEEMENAQELSREELYDEKHEAGKQVPTPPVISQVADMTQREGEQLQLKVASSSSINSMYSDVKESSSAPEESDSEYTNDGDSGRDDVMDYDPLKDMSDEEIRKSFNFISTPGMTVYFDS